MGGSEGNTIEDVLPVELVPSSTPPHPPPSHPPLFLFSFLFLSVDS